MKQILDCVLLSLVTLMLGGCARYDVTLTNGNVITAKSRPKLDSATNLYRFKDATGKEILVPSMRIRSIETR